MPVAQPQRSLDPADQGPGMLPGPARPEPRVVIAKRASIVDEMERAPAPIAKRPSIPDEVERLRLRSRGARRSLTR